MEANPQLADASNPSELAKKPQFPHHSHHHNYNHHQPNPNHQQHHNQIHHQLHHNHLQQQQSQQQQYRQQQHNKRHQSRQQSSSQVATTATNKPSDQLLQSSKEASSANIGANTGTGGLLASSISAIHAQVQSSMAYQHKHALHRLRRLKKRAPHRDLVISFVPRLRTSIINRLDFFNRYSKQEQEVLSCFDFLDELVLNYCDGGTESPVNSRKLYESMIYELI